MAPSSVIQCAAGPLRLAAKMNQNVPPPKPDRAWQPTLAGDLAPPAPAAPRPQPPLREAIKGLDTRELDSQTVFDQLFGDLPEKPDKPGPPNKPR